MRTWALANIKIQEKVSGRPIFGAQNITNSHRLKLLFFIFFYAWIWIIPGLALGMIQCKNFKLLIIGFFKCQI